MDSPTNISNLFYDVYLVESVTDDIWSGSQLKSREKGKNVLLQSLKSPRPGVMVPIGV